MKTYVGKRHAEGTSLKVHDWRQGEIPRTYPLLPYRDVVDYGGSSLDWGETGNAARQLAFAILMDHYRDRGRAQQSVDSFAEQIVKVPRWLSRWEFTSDELEGLLAQVEGRKGA
jgi:hypothetical protein